MVAWVGLGEAGGRNDGGTTLGGGREHLDYDDSFRSVYMVQNLSNCTLYVSLLCVSCISINTFWKRVKKKKKLHCTCRIAPLTRSGKSWQVQVFSGGVESLPWESGLFSLQ